MSTGQIIVIRTLAAAAVTFQLVGCQSYSAISQTELSAYLDTGSPSRIQVLDQYCRRYEGETWKIVDDSIELPDTTLPVSHVSMVRKSAGVGPSLLMAAVVGVPLGLFSSVMSQLEGDETRFEGFVSGFVVTGLPVFLLMNASKYRSAAKVEEGTGYARRIRKRELPC